MIAMLWSRVQGTVAAILLVLGAIVSAWVVGRKTGGELGGQEPADVDQLHRRAAEPQGAVEVFGARQSQRRQGRLGRGRRPQLHDPLGHQAEPYRPGPVGGLELHDDHPRAQLGRRRRQARGRHHAARSDTSDAP